jgi:adenosylhomocysteine nucleosidase
LRYAKIGIIGAMKEEIELFLEQMEQVQISEKAKVQFLEGLFHNKKVVICKSGVGKVNAAVTTQILIDTYGVDAIIFTGVAGAVDPGLDVGDIVIASELLQHDMDVTALGFPRGTIPFEEVSLFITDEWLRQAAVDASTELFPGHVHVGRILSGDQFIASRETVAKLHNELQGTCTEMEGAAVAQVCAMNSIPQVVIRSMSDKADGSAEVNFAQFTVQASENSYRIVNHMLKHL